MARNRDQAVARYFQAVADNSSVPVLLYSVPVYTDYSLPVPIIEKLTRHRDIVGMKDSSGDVVRLQAIVDATPSNFVLDNGASRAFTSAATVGCHGAISAIGNYAPEPSKGIHMTQIEASSRAVLAEASTLKPTV